MFRIKFSHGQLGQLQSRLLKDLASEQFAVLLGRRSTLDRDIIRIVAARHPAKDDIVSNSRTHVTADKRFIHRILEEIDSRLDVDTIIDVHTHPFSTTSAIFSGVDDNDEIHFCKFLGEHRPHLLYGSIVLSQSEYSARIWVGGANLKAKDADVVPQRALERIPKTMPAIRFTNPKANDHVFAKVDPVLGVPDLRSRLSDEKIVVVGLGGLGSLIVENLIQMGFSNLVLIDPDRVELSNLSRLAGATRSDAARRALKVNVSRRRSREVNRSAKIATLPVSIDSNQIIEQVKTASWIIVATDNHSSRLSAQRLSHDLFIPLLSAGVNITVNDGVVTDESGEVMLLMNGASACLICTGRVNLAKVAQETHPFSSIRDLLVKRGYVSGRSVDEPAVKTLNSVLAALSVDTLVDQYTGRRTRPLLQVYNNTELPRIIHDEDSVPEAPGCFACQISEARSTEVT